MSIPIVGLSQINVSKILTDDEGFLYLTAVGSLPSKKTLKIDHERTLLRR